jgi:hypothetical protein
MIRSQIVLKIQNFSILPIVNIDNGEDLSEELMVKSEQVEINNGILSWNIYIGKIHQDSKTILTALLRIRSRTDYER